MRIYRIVRPVPHEGQTYASTAAGDPAAAQAQKPFGTDPSSTCKEN